MNSEVSASQTIVSLLGGLICLGLSAAMYIVPTLFAFRRMHPNRVPILVVNLLLGWTLIGYVVALAWAFTSFSDFPSNRKVGE